MAEELWDVERIGREIRPDEPLNPNAVRKEMSRAGIRVKHGYPRRLVMAYLKRRKGRGYRTDLKD